MWKAMRRGLAAAALLAIGALHASAAEPPEPVALTGPIAVAQGDLAPLDVDTYSVTLAAGDQLFVALFDSKDGAFTDTRVDVLQGAAVVASDDDGGDGFLSRLAFQASAGGSYTIRITGFRDEDGTGAHAEGADVPALYTLVVGIGKPPLSTETEPNDAAGSGNALGAAGGIVRGSLSALDLDRFAIPVAAGSSLAVSLFPIDGATGAPARPLAARFDTRLGVFAGGAAPFAQNDDGGPGFFSNLERAVPAGGSAEIAVTGFRDTGYAGAHAEGPVDYVLVAAPVAGTTVARCDVAPPTGRIDTADIDVIFGARGTAASGPSDPRDADGDGQITVLDASQCRLQCTFPRCKPTACGLLGIEPLGVLALLEVRRRRRARAREQEVRG